MKTIAVARGRQVVSLHGHGIKIYVNRGHLILEDGIADQRNQIRVPRAARSIERVVMHGYSGYVTFEALEWMRHTGMQFVQLGQEHEVISLADAEPDLHVATLRTQVETVGTAKALEISKQLIRQKIEGHLSLVNQLERETTSKISDYLQLIPDAQSFDDLLAIEASAGHVYWQAWRGTPIHLDASTEFPEHWYTFRTRLSLLSKNARRAVDPINAILNYLYGLVYAEATLTLRTIGLDPRIGVMHSEIRGRNSLTCDIMEPVRYSVDRWVLEQLRDRVFTADHFFELRDGQCRILPELGRELSDTMLLWSDECVKVAKQVYTALVGKRAKKRM